MESSKPTLRDVAAFYVANHEDYRMFRVPLWGVDLEAPGPFGRSGLQMRLDGLARFRSISWIEVGCRFLLQVDYEQGIVQVFRDNDAIAARLDKPIGPCDPVCRVIVGILKARRDEKPFAWNLISIREWRPRTVLTSGVTDWPGYHDGLVGYFKALLFGVREDEDPLLLSSRARRNLVAERLIAVEDALKALCDDPCGDKRKLATVLEIVSKTVTSQGSFELSKDAMTVIAGLANDVRRGTSGDSRLFRLIETSEMIEDLASILFSTRPLEHAKSIDKELAERNRRRAKAEEQHLVWSEGFVPASSDSLKDLDGSWPEPSEPVGPDSFPGTDEGSRLMSQTRMKP